MNRLSLTLSCALAVPNELVFKRLEVLSLHFYVVALWTFLVPRFLGFKDVNFEIDQVPIVCCMVGLRRCDYWSLRFLSLLNDGRFGDWIRGKPRRRVDLFRFLFLREANVVNRLLNLEDLVSRLPFNLVHYQGDLLLFTFFSTRGRHFF